MWGFEPVSIISARLCFTDLPGLPEPVAFPDMD